MEELTKAIENHIEKFDIEPNDIGMIRDPLELAELIQESIEENEPYDEYKQLSPELREEFDSGTLLF